jgi:ABC-type antimicrobial peptide transport system permease subunit
VRGWTSTSRASRPSNATSPRTSAADRACRRSTPWSGSRGNYDLNQDSKNLALYLGVVALLVLLLVCANVANLLISRATSRHREISVRLSMGATRPRLVRQLLTESLLLAVIGGALGVLVGYWSRQLLPFGQTTPIDWRVFAFSGGLSVVTGVLFGLLPAFRATRVDLASDMKESSRSVTASRSWLSRALLVVQVAVSLVLLVGAGLFLRTVSNLRSVNVGFNTSNLLTFNVNPSLNRSDPDLSAQLLRDVQNRLANVPGVRSVAATRVLPLSGSSSSSNLHTPSQPKESEMYMMSVSPEFLSTMEIPLLTGRGLTERDNNEAPKVAVINETAARKLFAEANPIGQRVGFSKEKNTEYEIVGVSRDTKVLQPARAAAADALPELHADAVARGHDHGAAHRGGSVGDGARSSRGRSRRRTEHAADQHRHRGGAGRTWHLAGQARRERHDVVRRARDAARLDRPLRHHVLQRGAAHERDRHPHGARRAASPGGGMVLGESLLMVGIGLAAGLGAAVVLARYLGTWIGSKLFQMAMTDVVTIGGAALLLLAVSTLAGFLPARRASKVDPLIALQRQ